MVSKKMLFKDMLKRWGTEYEINSLKINVDVPDYVLLRQF